MPEIEFGLFLREDGMVDWEEARAKGGEVAKFGQEVQMCLSVFTSGMFFCF